MNNTARFFRSLALFIILYQFRLIAGDMADTPVYVATMLMAFCAAVFLNAGIFVKKIPRSLTAIIILILIPWIARMIIAAPGIFIRRAAASSITITLDSLLLNLDRNNFISLLPFYWAAVTTWFSLRSRRFLRSAVVADAVLLLAVYCVVRTADITMYRWPIVMIIVFSGVVFLQSLALLFSLPIQSRLRTAEIIPAVLALMALIILSGIIFLGPSQKRALEKGGGLLEPKLFSFDFSKFLKLDSEISMNDDLIMIVKKDGDDDDDHILLRRSVLSGYGRKQGFYRIEDIDEQTHPQRLPGRPTELFIRQPSPLNTSRIRQEYFLVNFDATAFIAMNQPMSVTPYENWDASSFRSAFMAESIASNASWRDLSHATADWPTAEDLGLTQAEFNIYTEYGDDERIRAYAEELTQGTNQYNGKVLMIHSRLKYGEYRYSLKPGIAPDGDQLAWFLFNTKKGYCSYYAFAMTLMLRSLGIPARVAAGFFIDPETNTFDYYPVRSDMAHAWVEVLYPGYGWIEFDPTTEELAEGEEFNFSAGVDPNLFERLMREILENRWLLRAKDGREATAASSVSSLMRATVAMFKKYWIILLLVVMAIPIFVIHCKYFIASALHTDNRKKAVRLWKHCRQRLRLAGIRPAAAAHEAEWAHNVDALVPGVYSLYQNAAAARFAPLYTPEDFTVMHNNYRAFSAAYRRAVSPVRRIIAWVLPLLALWLPGKTGGRPGMKKKRRVTGGLPLVLLFVLLAGTDTNAQTADPAADADTLFQNARTAIYAENWERAIENLRIGGKSYPDDIRFPWTLGNLYYDRSLYGLAWDEFKRAETIDLFDEDIVIMLARTSGVLNESHTSVEYYQRALILNPDNRDAISNLGWMFYKVHRLTEGEKLMTDAIDRFGEDADFAMTLGTIYSAMYNYEKSKYWYQRAINLGREIGDMNFTAVAHYNLSILESRFYRYDLSMNETNASLNARRRASGMLARGELNMRRLELRQSQLDYQDAYEMDISPLAKLSLAQIYQISGRLEEARLYAQDCLRATDHTWMLNYGIDPDRYKRDIHDILHNTYEGLTRTETLTPWATPAEKIRSLFRKIVYRYKTAVHLRLYEKYSLAAADSFRAELSSESPLLDTTLQYFNSFSRYTRRARIYLDFARELETQMIPAAEPSYDLEEGVQYKNIRLLEQALAGLDPQWERLSIAECYREIANSRRKPLSPDDGAQRQIAAEELFALNRGGLRQAGLYLPVDVTILFDAEFSGMRRTEKLVRKSLEKTGFRIADNTPEQQSRYTLQLFVEDSEAGYSVLCELTDTQGTGSILRRSFILRNFSRAGIYEFARNLGSAVFVVE